MPIKHVKTDTIADWTQADLNAEIALGNYPSGTLLADIVLPSDWNDDHDLSTFALADAPALESDIAGLYVPYTGATTAVDLNNQDLTTVNNIGITGSGGGAGKGYLDLVEEDPSTQATPNAGFTRFFGTGRGVGINKDGGFTAELSLQNLTAYRRQLLQDVDDTFAYLSDIPSVPAFASVSDVNTGTSTTLIVNPDALAGSYAGTSAVNIVAFDAETDVETGDGKAYIVIPAKCNGHNLTRAIAVVNTAGVTGATTIQIHNLTQAADMLTGLISVASGGTVATAGTIDAANDDVVTNDVLRVDVDSVSTTAPIGLIIILEFMPP